jgi:hypothetical protein
MPSFNKAKQGRFAQRGLTVVQSGIVSVWKKARNQSNTSIK